LADKPAVVIVDSATAPAPTERQLGGAICPAPILALRLHIALITGDNDVLASINVAAVWYSASITPRILLGITLEAAITVENLLAARCDIELREQAIGRILRLAKSFEQTAIEVAVDIACSQVTSRGRVRRLSYSRQYRCQERRQHQNTSVPHHCSFLPSSLVLKLRISLNCGSGEPVAESDLEPLNRLPGSD
jgi:hypothetical protein